MQEFKIKDLGYLIFVILIKKIKSVHSLWIWNFDQSWEKTR